MSYVTAYIPSRERLTFYGGGPGYDALEYQTVTFILTDGAQISNRLMADSDNSQPTPLKPMGMTVAIIIDCSGRIWLSYVEVLDFFIPLREMYTTILICNHILIPSLKLKQALFKNIVLQ